MIRTIASTGSTNADLLSEARAGAPEATWLRAERQTGGRGRAGRSWKSPAGNLYASTIVRVSGAEPPAPTLALVAAVALHEVASAYAASAAIRIKWPNDLLAGGAKLAGILLEREGEAVVIGFGVNLAHHPDLPERPTTSVAALGGGTPDPDAFLRDLAEAFARWLGRWRGEGLEPVRERWLAAAHPIGSALTASTADGAVTGLFDGLTAEGALRLRNGDGMQVIHAGDVFLI
jgi:BirA family transcriptional regulator, biotin operon repressor / biotin---[acetyl-CoA-carboxylase] ligase